MMNGPEKSDPAIVAGKPTNKAEQSAAELVEPRAGTKGNAGQQSTCRTQSRVSVSRALERIRRLIAVTTRGGSRMRESRTYGSVRGARGNSRPYREQVMSVHGTERTWRYVPLESVMRAKADVAAIECPPLAQLIQPVALIR
jgi:hypothetical protein